MMMMQSIVIANCELQPAPNECASLFVKQIILSLLLAGERTLNTNSGCVVKFYFHTAFRMYIYMAYCAVYAMAVTTTHLATT